MAASRPAQMTTEWLKTSPRAGFSSRQGAWLTGTVQPSWRGGACAVSNHGAEGFMPSDAAQAPLAVQHVQATPGPALAAGAAQRDRCHRRAGPPPADGARRHHRPADPGEADPGSRLRVPPGARGRHDARLVERHRGILPLDTIESIWRVIISTFTYVQAPFAVHADVSVGESAMRDSARFHFGFVVPYVGAFQRAGGGRGGGEIEGRSGAGLGDLQPHAVVARAGSRTARQRSSPGCRSSSAPTIRPRCPCS